MEQHDEISGTVGKDAKHTAVGKDIQQVSIYSDRLTWREFVRRDLESLEQRFMILLITVFFLFVLGAIATGLTIRQFDLTYLQIERQNLIFERQIERLERMIPTPTPWWVFPGGPLRPESEP